jgi:hypothetical protein
MSKIVGQAGGLNHIWIEAASALDSRLVVGTCVGAYQILSDPPTDLRDLEAVCQSVVLEEALLGSEDDLGDGLKSPK